MKWLTVFTLALCCWATTSHAQSGDIAAHIEVHAIPSLTLSDTQVLTGSKDGKPVMVGGVLRLAQASGRQPAVVLIHGSSGMGPNMEMWERIFNAMGIATFAIDGFTGRGIVSTSRDQSQLGRLNLIIDAYGALSVLAHHPRIDPQRIVLMGFSRGGQATLYAAMRRLHRLWNTSGARFQAYIPFYPDCMTRYRDDTDVDASIREFHGAADDYDPPQKCAEYVDRLRKAGNDVVMTVYPEAHHAFDLPFDMPPTVAKGSQTVRACEIAEDEKGRLINLATRSEFSFQDACVQLDPHVGANSHARESAIRDVRAYLGKLFSQH